MYYHTDPCGQKHQPPSKVHTINSLSLAMSWIINWPDIAVGNYVLEIMHVAHSCWSWLQLTFIENILCSPPPNAVIECVLHNVTRLLQVHSIREEKTIAHVFSMHVEVSQSIVGSPPPILFSWLLFYTPLIPLCWNRADTCVLEGLFFSIHPSSAAVLILLCYYDIKYYNYCIMSTLRDSTVR